MASGKEIRTQIKSIENTQKITRAMEMVAASKMRRAQDRMAASRPYAQKMLSVIEHVSHAHAEFPHPYLLDRPVKRIGVILVSSDRGLCGGLNTNLFKRTVQLMTEWHEKGAEIDLCTLGQKGFSFFSRLKAKIVAQQTQLGDAPRIEDLIGSVKVMLDAFNEGRIDKLFLMHNTFVNTMTQQPTPLQLLPIQPRKKEKEMPERWDYLYEPDAQEVLTDLMDRYIESQVYQGLVENVACEQAARMVAMKSASDNAGNLIGDLKLAYNKARQAAITQELSEIVSGAAAV
ncbi:MAG: F0F1 ATP synthase subunit gamma [Chromatiales bacterium]|nr:F0F1 ATP synthase subunit gamma [Chromatiales bacterium]